MPDEKYWPSVENTLYAFKQAAWYFEFISNSKTDYVTGADNEAAGNVNPGVNVTPTKLFHVFTNVAWFIENDVILPLKSNS